MPPATPATSAPQPDLSLTQQPQRVTFMDALRVLACFMVIMVHSGEYFYIGPGDVIIRDHTYGADVYGSALRACVPLFVLASGYLLLPIRESTGTFFRRRFTRILAPFVVWSVIYVLYFHKYTDALSLGQQVLLLGVNWTSGHLWFVYMLLGLYAFAPVISPWLRDASAREERWFLLAWCVTLLLPYVRLYVPQVWGEAFWNPIGGAYYFSGYLGYFVLGHYLRVHLQLSPTRCRALGLGLLLLGYGLTYWGFASRLPWARSVSELELTWAYLTGNVAMMTVGWYLLLRDLPAPGARAQQWLAKGSQLSFGVYLAHILVLEQVHHWLVDYMPPGLLVIPVQATLTFALTYVLVAALSYLPNSRYLIG
ncbi:surface polysaccharide O-acyltransferase-like enzyme [Spirosoma oryzae]|uniref:Surface polysaccharide O-acyltransferase-like enzyme n=1 Tax=Spirosoma oryzae TaxID=1469603 RepID=A0A2T0TEY5_9BACT|nr:acyltransferase family protein [Spirosoma oryzae]PRY44232.1 surface polysaccharide O-acyltransferase-like enzyme [Spirosoma oryzae]